MELTINCGSFVEINKLLSIVEMNGDIGKYKLEENFLEGSAILSGKYVKDDSGEFFEFLKEVPFTLVFKDKNVNINKIDIVDLHFSEVINQGIETTFEIFIDYDVLTNDDFIINSEEKEEHLKETDENDLLEFNEENELIEEIDFNSINEELNEIKEEIVKSYDDLLDDILLSNNRDNVEINEMKKENNRVAFTKFKESYSTYRVYYPKDEKEVEKICGENNRSLDEVYKNNGDFNEKRRIILK